MTNYSNRPAKRLTLSVTDRKIAGVCGGIAEYFNVDPTLVRVITVALALLFGGGLLAYLLAWIIMPEGQATRSTWMCERVTHFMPRLLSDTMPCIARTTPLRQETCTP